MIFGNIKNIGDLKNYPPILEKALRYLSENDFTKISSGIYEIIGREMFVQVIDLETDAIENKLPEVHINYLDIHFLAKGIEKIGFSIDCDLNKISKNYDKNRDILFYEDCHSESFINMIEGNFAIFFPNDVHRPGCTGKEKSIIKKVVIKIHKKLLKEFKR